MTSTITTQAHSHQNENSTAPNTKLPGMTSHYEDYYRLQAIRHKETFHAVIQPLINVAHLWYAVDYHSQ